ncbi:MAG: thermonuclease family protein [Acidobacteria bacterium]|nr:thermonuclease family protein [Acidobacteriota bacterium]
MRNLLIIIGLLVSINFTFINTFAQKKANKRKVENPETTTTIPTGPPTVSKVINGDLLQLTNGELVRLMGADTPVMPLNGKIGQEPWASQAKTFTERLSMGKELTINSLGLTSDEYGRRIGLVYIGELWLDYELVKEGFAVVQNNRYLDNKSKQLLLDAQSEALTFGRGIWQTDNRIPLPPKEFRAANGLSESDKPKDESWKFITTKPSTKTVTTSNNASSSSNNVTDPSTNESKYVYAIDLLETLKQVQGRLDSGGLGTSELAKLINIADGKAQAMVSNKTDPLLAKCLREALDAYKVLLDGFKKREVSKDEERVRLSKLISDIIEIADKAIADSENRLAKINK